MRLEHRTARINKFVWPHFILWAPPIFGPSLCHIFCQIDHLLRSQYYSVSLWRGSCSTTWLSASLSSSKTTACQGAYCRSALCSRSPAKRRVWP